MYNYTRGEKVTKASNLTRSAGVAASAEHLSYYVVSTPNKLPFNRATTSELKLRPFFFANFFNSLWVLRGNRTVTGVSLAFAILFIA